MLRLPLLRVTLSAICMRAFQGRYSTSCIGVRTLKSTSFPRSPTIGCSTVAAGAPLAAGDPFGYLHQGTDGPVQHAVYRGQDGHIHELYTLSNKWVFNTLTASGGAPLAGGDPFGYLHQAAAGPCSMWFTGAKTMTWLNSTLPEMRGCSTSLLFRQ